jgi:multiple sugar transport system substrate-binding protein
MLRFWSWTSAIAGAAFALSTTLGAQAGEFDGVTVNVMTQTGAIQEPLQRRAPDFEKATGAKINIIAVPFSDLYQKVLTDWASGTNSVDAAVFAPQWMVDYVSGGYLEELGPRIAKDPKIKWDEIGPFFRNFSATYGGKTYLVPLDGDFHMLYYRTDVLEKAGLKPPKTWDEYLEVAKALNGKDFNGDVHRKETQRAKLLVRHRHHLLDGPGQGDEPGRVLRHQGHEAPGRQRRLP